jgi:hypothetical protein
VALAKNDGDVQEGEPGLRVDTRQPTSVSFSALHVTGPLLNLFRGGRGGGVSTNLMFDDELTKLLYR